MSLLMNHAGVKQSGYRIPGASRSVRPEIPSKPVIAPTPKPSTAAPAKPVTAPKPAVSPQPASPAKSSAQWMYRGIAVDPVAVRTDRMLTQAARVRSSSAIVYRGITVDPAIAREQELLTQVARARSTAPLTYRGIPVPHGPKANSGTACPE